MTRFIRLVDERPRKYPKYDWRYILLGCGIWGVLTLLSTMVSAWAPWG